MRVLTLTGIFRARTVKLILRQMADLAKHAFAVGETFHDRVGTYKVISIEGNRLRYAYPDGIERVGDAETKWRIHQNILSDSNPSLSVRVAQRYGRGADSDFFTHAEAFPIIANLIERQSRAHGGYIEHAEIVKALMSDPQGQVILERRPDKTKKWSAGVMVAWFSKAFTEGTSDWDSRFMRKKISGSWAYRVRRDK